MLTRLRTWTAPADTEAVRGRRRGSWLFDVAVTAVALLVSFPYVAAADARPIWLTAVVSVAINLALVARRLHPLPVFAAMYLLGACTAWWLPNAALSVAFVVALYTVATRCPRRVTLVTAALLAAGAVVWSGRVYGHRGSGWFAFAMFLVAVIAATTAFGLYIATRRSLLAAVRERARRLEVERDQQATIAAAAERARIARELHDIVAHHLTVMVSLADGAIAQAGRAPQRSGDAMRSVAATGREALADTRRLLGVLRDASGESNRAPLPCLADLDDLVSGVRAAGLAVRYEVVGAAPPLAIGSQVALYRLVQESLTNTLRHAAAGSADVRISYGADAVRVRVSDDGTAAAGTDAAPGRGLLGMRERLTAVGGALEYGPARDGGWSVSAEIPVPR